LITGTSWDVPDGKSPIMLSST